MSEYAEEYEEEGEYEEEDYGDEEGGYDEEGYGDYGDEEEWDEEEEPWEEEEEAFEEEPWQDEWADGGMADDGVQEDWGGGTYAPAITPARTGYSYRPRSVIGTPQDTSGWLDPFDLDNVATWCFCATVFFVGFNLYYGGFTPKSGDWWAV